ncbi:MULTISPECIES: hypothetical protein [unclassified Streptomyces]|nr:MULTISPECIES: hypothetical protein [unclassified Streptomyces]
MRGDHDDVFAPHVIDTGDIGILFAMLRDGTFYKSRPTSAT